jgi:hypothetical protein
MIGLLSGKKEPCELKNYHIEGDDIIIHDVKTSGKILNGGNNIRIRFKGYTINLQKKQ